jgi:hypothetical protein
MRNLSPKNTLLAIFLVTGVLILYSCIVPVGQLEKFLEDDTVQDYIENGTDRVIVDDQTGDGLVGRGSRIQGLSADKYYMVSEEKDANQTSVGGYPKYVMTDTTSKEGYGILTSNLGDLTKISGGRITGLTNFHTYTVYAATPVSGGSLAYTDDGVPQTAITIPTTGVITIPSPEGDCELDLSGVFGTGGSYIAIPITESRTNYTAGPVTTTPVSQKAGTTVDYVFSDGTSANFKVLRVVIGAIVFPTINITINFDIVDGTPRLSQDSHTFKQSEFDLAQNQTITVSSTFDTIGWYYNGQPVGGETLTLTNDTAGLSYLERGVHKFTVVVTINGIPYSADFTLTVEP